jgi:O-antigen/teichoic acid export membrane protein
MAALIGGALMAITGTVALLLVPVGDICWPILGMLACLVPFAYQGWLEGVARGLDRPGLALACPYLLRPVLMGAALALAAYLGHATAGAAMLAVFMATLVTASIQTVLVHRAARRILGEGEARGSVRVWLASSAPLAGNTACTQAAAYADMLALGLMRAPAEAAIYIAASRTLALASFAQYALSVVAGRRFAAAKADGGHAALEALSAASTRLTVLASLAAVTLILVAGVPLLSLFGQLFASAYPALAILCIGAMARAVAGQKEAILTVLGFQRGLFLISLATLAVAIFANLGLTSAFGATGAACASALSAIFRSALVIALARIALASRGRGAA